MNSPSPSPLTDTEIGGSGRSTGNPGRSVGQSASLILRPIGRASCGGDIGIPENSLGGARMAQVTGTGWEACSEKRGLNWPLEASGEAWLGKAVGLALAGGLFLASCEGSPAPAWADWNSNLEETYVQIILSEAAGEPMDGQIAVCEVLRNRHWSTRGFAGIKRADLRKWLARQAPEAFDRAGTAYRRARAGSQLAGGATHFENVEAFGTPWWAEKMTKVAKIGRHTFFK